jgi:ATP-dependent DNA helicase RecG
MSLPRRPLQQLRGVGPRLAERLQAYGIADTADLLFHFPLRYQDRTRITPIGELVEGSEALVEGEVQYCDVFHHGRRSLLATIEDDSGQLGLRLFHFSAAQRHQLSRGNRVRCFGQTRFARGGLEMVHPEYQVVSPGMAQPEQTLTPVYPSTEGISQQLWRKLCAQALALLEEQPPEDLLADCAAGNYRLPEAIRLLHRPPPGTRIDQLQQGRHPAQLRLALEELVAHQLALRALRERERAHAAPLMPADSAALQAFLGTLPFTPTAAQQRVIAEISADLARSRPMLRLLQGDVGSGKTLVAAAAARQAIAAGYQVAVMAPTEILAEQHLQNFGHWFAQEPIEIAWLSGRVKGRARREALEAIASGRAALAVGTHALFQETVQFARLGLLIVDEQHRFGVHQRLSLRNKAVDWHPHQLVMTATPIPRTLSMVAYADLDCSVIDELPPGRQPVSTALVDSRRRAEVIARVGAACREGRQAYWVCTLIEESDALQAQAAEVTYEELCRELPELRSALIHGRLPPAEKAAIMQAFKNGEYALLVATTVIEVGVDVPRASLMVIENPERLGLAQLHQLRGRVGRGQEHSHCLLLYQHPLSQLGRERLQAMRESNDGFYIAERDLELRGPGEVLGTRQTGLMAFRVARLPEHDALLDTVQHCATQLLSQHPERAQALIERWTGGRQVFAGV